MTTILAPTDYYLPGTNAGGALRSIANLVATLGDEFEFRIITRDRDWLSDKPYPHITTGEWESVGRAKVMYLSQEQARPALVRWVIAHTPHDVLYLNSLFAPLFTLSVLVHRRLGMIPKRPVILAPRGQLSPGAVEIKRPKKRVLLAAAHVTALYRGVIWQASSVHEEKEIHEHFDAPGAPVPTVIAPDLPTPWEQLAVIAHRRKSAGSLKVCFVSRITRKKNLLGAIELLRQSTAETAFDVYGPLDEPDYMRECETAMATLPSHVRGRYVRALAYDEIAPTFARYDVFLFPTRGENYGHVIIESLAAGCPVIVSDRTPFRDLEEHEAGWVVPLDEPEGFHRALATCAAMGPDEHARMSNAAREYARRVITDPAPIAQHRELFRRGARDDGASHADARRVTTQNIA